VLNLQQVKKLALANIKNKQKQGEENVMPLTYAPIGEPAVIRKITGKDEVRQHLAELGFVVGQQVTVVSSLAGNLIINVKGSRIALDAAMAQRVML
jgi:hypothetical protein